MHELYFSRTFVLTARTQPQVRWLLLRVAALDPTRERKLHSETCVRTREHCSSVSIVPELLRGPRSGTGTPQSTAVHWSTLEHRALACMYVKARNSEHTYVSDLHAMVSTRSSWMVFTGTWGGRGCTGARLRVAKAQTLMTGVSVVYRTLPYWAIGVYQRSLGMTNSNKWQ